MPPRGKKFIKTPDLKFGGLIRECRQMKKLSMESVAEQAGLTIGFISQVERNITVPSLVSLQSIARVLGQRLSFFLERPFDDDDITRPHERLAFRELDDGVTIEVLSRGFPGSEMQSALVYQPGGFRSEPIHEKGEAVVFIQEGELTFEFKDESKVLKVGESIHFDSTRTHTVWNHTDKRTVSLWTGTLAIFSEDD